MQGTAGVALAQGPENYIVRFREGTSAAARAAVVRGAGAALGVNFGRVNAAAVRVPNENALAALRNNPSVLAVIPNRPCLHTRTEKGSQEEAAVERRRSFPLASLELALRPAARMDLASASRSSIPVSISHILTSRVPSTRSTRSAVRPARTTRAMEHMSRASSRPGTTRPMSSAWRRRRQSTVSRCSTAPAAVQTRPIMSGLEWVLNNHASVVPAIKVVNMSLGRPGSVDDNPDMHDLIVALEDAGITVVVAAGNDAAVDASGQIPAAYPEVIAVASTTALAGTNQCRFLGAPIVADTASYFTTDGAG